MSMQVMDDPGAVLAEEIHRVLYSYFLCEIALFFSF